MTRRSSSGRNGFSTSGHPGPTLLITCSSAITWTRLVRPDGITIDLDSPGTDIVGRGGVAASANSHFLASFANKVVRLTTDVGRAIAAGALAGPLVLLPGNNGASQVGGPPARVPTLKVPPGRSISVFVAHDLDFSAAGAGS